MAYFLIIKRLLRFRGLPLWAVCHHYYTVVIRGVQFPS